jgi:hypothetical protein
MYRGRDCHAYTADCRAAWNALRAQQPELGQDMAPADVAQLFARLLAAPRPPAARQALIKMRQRSGSTGYGDSQLPGLNVTRLLAAVEGADAALLNEVLGEIGQTCVQGDSHRLLMLHTALRERAASATPSAPESDR